MFARIASALVLGATAAACSVSGEAARPQETPGLPVKVQTLASSRIRDTTEYIATLKSRHSILLQPQVDGQIVKILVKAGATVEPGALIMQINPARQHAAVTSAQASRAARLATLNYAKQQLDRAQRLYEGGAVSRQELDQARANFESAQAEVESLGAQIRQNEVQLDYYRIVAPAHGVVGDIPVRVGDYVNPATRLTTIDENGLLEAYISVPVERAAALSDSTEVQLVDAAGAIVGGGRVTFVSPQVNEETQSVLLKTVVQNAGNTLRAAQFVRARVVWSTHDGVTVPTTAVLYLNGQPFVYVVEDKGGKSHARQRPLALGEIVDGAYVVLSGVKAGERIVTSSIQKLGDGAPITVAAGAQR